MEFPAFLGGRALDNLKGQVRDYLDVINIGQLPQPAYPEQFDAKMDCPERPWADRFILIASTPRSGSHYLGHMLGATGECGVPLEYLHGFNKRYWIRRFKVTQMEDLFAEIVRRRTSANGTFTLKAHWGQFRKHIDDLDTLTRGVSFEKVLWIVRRDQLGQAVSRVIAQQTNAWISGAKRIADARFDYDEIVKSAVSARKANQGWHGYIAGLPSGSSMKVVFEDLLSDSRVCDDLQSFLGLLERPRPAERTRRQGNSLNAEWKERFASEVRDDHTWILDPPDWA